MTPSSCSSSLPSPSHPKQTRNAMKCYWEQHQRASASSSNPLQAMMLDTNAPTLHEKEKQEIFSYLPLQPSMDGLELASGIGRYTSSLSAQLSHLTTVEFIPEFASENELRNQDCTNVTFVCNDVMNLTFPPNTFDVVFSNWLFMYLNDEEIATLFGRIGRWLRPNGYFFFRESCWRSSGNITPKSAIENPTYYRPPSFYVNLLHYMKVVQLQQSSNVTVYREMKQNPGQLWYLFQKNQLEEAQSQGQSPLSILATTSLQQFFDSQRYSKTNIKNYELLFGKGFVSTGGITTTREFLERLDLQANQIVLDVGCGLGGGDVYMAQKYGVQVVGVDLCTNMVYEAIQRSMNEPEAKSVMKQIHYLVSDITTTSFPNDQFDVIYSRDTILHIADKQSLFKQFYRWLKPGGKLLITDYCRNKHPSEWSDEMNRYMETRKYTLHTVKEYGELIQQAGFVQVQAQDMTERLIEESKRELNITVENKETFIQNSSASEYEEMKTSWETKIQRHEKKEQAWGMFYAEKKL